MRPSDLLVPTPAGLYCPPADVHIDPVRPVRRALVTHGHGDHARSGHGAVLATRETLAIMAARYGEDFAGTTQAADLAGPSTSAESLRHSIPPAMCWDRRRSPSRPAGTRIVVSGDYKRAHDPTCLPFEVVPCDVFITEATFGLPVFRHPRRAPR